ncbi:AAA family ATPase [Paenibacillus xerothermodurans]|nr:AAA family ATPase [Paenibacillus xerothermodurans]
MYLNIAGLQSYRAPQEIDFTALCDAGVFGIFGPTGSGKSSILDAMTLALFGKVERAANGTQGIMNHAEQTLSVSFTFELGQAEGAVRYRVDRQFKRGGEVSVNNTVSRLIRYQDGETIVLADKAGEVNQRVHDILGLSMQDFTRAVVLPQGKFAEFLALKGSERRQMLQRLFHLEPYGDQLSAKTAARFKATDAAIKELAAEQQGLGDASQQALDAAAEALRAAARAAQQLREQLIAREARAAELRRVRELQQALARVQRHLAEHAARAPHVHALKARLTRAAHAERAHPYARRRGLAAARLTRERDAAAGAADARSQAQAALERASAAHAAARDALAAQEAPLLLRLDKLQQALALADELAQQREQLGELAAREAQAASALQAARERQLLERGLRDKALQLQAELKEELQRTEVRSEARERLHEALQEKRAIEQLRRQLAEQQTELQRLQQELDTLNFDVEAARQQERQWAAGLGEWLQAASAVHQAAVRSEGMLQHILHMVSLAIAQRKQHSKDAELHTMAAELAAHLVSGEACLVCGATQHPQPFAVPEAPVGAVPAAADTSRLERMQTTAGQKLLSASQLLVTLSGAVQQCQPLLPQLLANEHLAEVAAALQEWEQVTVTTHQGVNAHLQPARQADAPERPLQELLPESAADLAETEQQLEQMLAEAAHGLQQAQAQIQQLQQQLQLLLQERSAIERLSAEKQAQRRTLSTLIETAQSRAARSAESLAEQITDWNGRFDGLSFDTVEAAVEQVRLQEKKTEELRQRLEKSVTYLDDKQSLIAGLQEQSSALDRTSVQLETELKNLQQQVTEKAARLNEWAGDQSVQEQLGAAKRRLDGLKITADQAKQELEAAQITMHAAAQADAAAARAVDDAAEQAQTAESEWLEHAALLGFAKPEEVQAAILDDEQKAAAVAEVEEYGRTEHQLQSEERQLTEHLASRSVTEEEWTALEADLAECKRQDEIALQTQAKAERDWESLQAKHARWSELESKRTAKQAELTLLSKLQSVLRGNAFVEFLAEEQLNQVSRAASERLGQLTRQKYAIEVDSTGGFIVRDDANGGVKRPVASLSGGETFLTSLSLALALSAQIQLKGQYPLEFFFLDEGFGTLDQDLLETVIVALEKLHLDKLTVGVISHVPELRARLPRRLVVQPPEPGGRGSTLSLETL